MSPKPTRAREIATTARHAFKEEVYRQCRRCAVGGDRLPQAFRKRKQRIAIDLTENPHHGQTMDVVVKRLLRQVRRIGVQVRFLLLDKGGFSVEVVRYLQAARCGCNSPLYELIFSGNGGIRYRFPHEGSGEGTSRTGSTD